MCALLFEIQRRFCFLTTLVDICRIEFCRLALKSHQNTIHSPLRVDTARSVSSFQLSYWSLPLMNFPSKYNIHPQLCVLLDFKSSIIRKTILSSKKHKLCCKKCPETESKSKILQLKEFEIRRHSQN